MPEVSVLSAADKAVQETVRQLLPPRFEKWLVLGFVAFLEQCGRSGTGCNVPNFGGGGGDGGAKGAEEFLAFMADHVFLVAGIAAAVLTLIIAIMAVALWLQSRGTFMYLDNVATGRFDVARPWREHAVHAGSYFAWVFGLGMGALVLLLVFLVPIGWSILALAKGGPRPVPLVVVSLSVFVLLVLLTAASLLSIALRNFVAPLQWYRNLSCGAALRLFFRLLAQDPLVFLLFLLGKLVVAIIAGVVGFAVGCVTCCMGFLPVVQQTLLQPLLYFDRRWSLEILDQLGFGPPPAAPSPPSF